MDLSFKPKVWLFIMMVGAVIFLWIFQEQFFRFSMLDTEDISIRRSLAERWAQRASVVAANDELLLDNRPTIQIARVVNDYDGLLTQQLKNWIGRRNLRVVNDRWFHDMGYTIGVNSEPNSIDEAARKCRSANADFIVSAEVENWTTFPDFDHELSGWLQIHDGHDRSILKRVKLSTSEGSMPIRRSDRSVNVADQIQTDQIRANIPVRGPQRQAVVELESSDLDATQSRLNSPINVLESANADPGESKPNSSYIELAYLGVSMWILILLGTPWAFQRAICKTLKKKSNYENGRLLLFWGIGVASSTMIIGASWLPFTTAMFASIAAAVGSCVYLGCCCRWFAEM